MSRRTFLRAGLGAGVLVSALGGADHALADLAAMKRARAELRPDGRPRLADRARLKDSARYLIFEGASASPTCSWRGG